MGKQMLIEVCANSVESAIAAQTGGAGRIELCGNLMEGGTTPSHAAIEIARKIISIPLNVLIRPRGGDFLYSDLEFAIMKRDIEVCKNLGIDGVVIGILDESGTVDVSRMHELISMARPMSITFHRAFDVCNDPFKALQFILGLGIDRLLTSGQQNNASAGIGLISELIKKSKGRIEIMAGGGINRANIIDFIRHPEIKEIHMTGKQVFLSRMKYKNMHVSLGESSGMQEYTRVATDVEEIKHMVSIINSLAHQL